MSRAPSRSVLRSLLGSMSRAIRPASILVLALLVASPLLAYTIYLKDGTKMVSREKYTVKDDKAFFTMQNGTQTYIALSEVDIERTDKANERDVGTALMVEGGEVHEVAIEDVQRESRRDRPTLRDLITSGAAGPSNLPDPAAPDPSARTNDAAPALPRTRAGFVDLSAVERTPFENADIAAEIRELFQRRELQEVEVFEGTESRRPLVEVVTGSEAGVFRAIVVASSALLQLQEQSPNQVSGIELLLTTPTGSRGGQFVIGPDEARALLTREIDPQAFFLRYVQF